MNDLLAIFLFSTLMRGLLLPSYHSTDFEVHRNWLAITYSLPFQEWYKEATSPWTLDYPPFFAYFEWILSHLAVLWDPHMLEISRLDYCSFATLCFQRISVIFTEILLIFGVLLVSKASLPSSSPERLMKFSSFLRSPSTSIKFALLCTLLNSGLLIVDRTIAADIHFQYNGFLIGWLLLSIASIQSGHFLLGAIFYTILLHLKHIFLFMSPIYFIFLLKEYCYPNLTSWNFRNIFQAKSIKHLFYLSFSVSFISFLSLAPIVWTGQISTFLSRLFPFNRGLTHSYWAPNIWSLYQGLDRCLYFVVSRFFSIVSHTSFRSSTAGLTNETDMAILPSITPRITFILSFLLYLPLLSLIWKSPKRILFPIYISIGCGIAFAAGWHIHEKAILYSILPLGAFVWSFGDFELLRLYQILNLIGNFSILPLLPHLHDAPLKWILFFGCSLLEFVCIQYNLNTSINISQIELKVQRGNTSQKLYSNGQHRHSIAFSKSYPIQKRVETSRKSILVRNYMRLSSFKSFLSAILTYTERYYLFLLLPIVGIFQFETLRALLHLQKFEFFPLMLTSMTSAIGILASFIKLFKRLTEISSL